MNTLLSGSCCLPSFWCGKSDISCFYGTEFRLEYLVCHGGISDHRRGTAFCFGAGHLFFRENLRELAGRVSPLYGILFSCALYLTIGPFFAIPRTATVSYESPFPISFLLTQGTWGFTDLYFFSSFFPGICPSALPSWCPASASALRPCFSLSFSSSSPLLFSCPWEAGRRRLLLMTRR